MDIIPMTEKEYELRELGRRFLNMLMDGLSKSLEAGIEVSEATKLYVFRKGDEMIDNLYKGNISYEEIEYLETLPPTVSYIKSKYSGRLTGGTDMREDLSYLELERRNVYFVNSQEDTPRRIKYVEETKSFKYEDEIKSTKTKKGLTYERIEEAMLNTLDSGSKLRETFKDVIEDCKAKNISPEEMLYVLKKTLDGYSEN